MISTLNFQPSAFAQGSLTPPGAPAPTLKTLDQVEPRTPISSLPFTISTPGSYYLTTNLTGVTGQNGISIEASGVTLDLMGFTITGDPTTAHGIHMTAFRNNVVIRNGHIRSWGGSGMATRIDVGRIENITAADNRGWGISNSAGSFQTHLSQCEALNNGAGGGGGIFVSGNSIIDECIVRANFGAGIHASSDGLLTRCNSGNNTGPGFDVQGGSIIGCVARFNGGHGIRVNSNCQVRDNTCDNNGVGGSVGAGILAVGVGNRIQDNVVSGNDVGLDVDNPQNYIAGNTVRQNTDNYDFVAGNHLNLLLCQLPENIDWPATVLVAGSLTGSSGTNGITVNANDVTIDLGGHTLIGVSGSENGIGGGPGFESRTNVVVRNGSLRQWGEYAVNLGGLQNQASDLAVSRNGGGVYLGDFGAAHNVHSMSNAGYGIVVGDNGRATDCQAIDNTGPFVVYGIFGGINSVISGCSAFGNFATDTECSGIYGGAGSTIQNCTAMANRTLDFSTCYGIRGDAGASIIGCTATGNQSEGSGYGIYGGTGSAIRDCVARNNDAQGNGYGIFALDGSVVAGCSSFNNTADGTFSAGILAEEGSTIVNCSAADNFGDTSSLAIGIYGLGGSTISGCTVRRQEGGPFAAVAGIYGDIGSTVMGCTVQESEEDGIRVAHNSVVKDNNVSFCGSMSVFAGNGAGIHAVGSDNRVEGNNVTRCDRGFDVDNTGNVITRNSASGNTTNYDIVGGNDVGPIGTAAASTSPWANIAY